MAATVHIYRRHLLLLLSSKADINLTSYRGWKAESTIGTAGRVRSPCPRLYITVAVVINRAARPAASHTAVSHATNATTKPLRPAEVRECEQLA